MKQTLLIFLLLFIAGITRSQTVVNGNFDTWITGTTGFLEPDEWVCSNTNGNAVQNVLQDVGHNGSGYSVKIIGATVVGIPIADGGDIEAFFKNYSGSTRPVSLKGFWKTSNVALGDYLIITVDMYNASMGIVASEMLQTSPFSPNMAWTAFEIPFNYIAADPVTKYSIFIGLSTFSAQSINSVGWVDDLAFDVGTGVNEINNSLSNLNVFNDGSGYHLQFDNAKISKVNAFVTDVTGKQVMMICDQTLTPGRQDILFNTAELSAGIYSCVVSMEGEKRSLRFTVAK